MNGALLASGEEVAITFGDRVVRQAVIDAEPSESPVVSRGRTPRKAAKPAPPDQGDLF
jgi:exodeoxyribonuclease VII large subunit